MRDMNDKGQEVWQEALCRRENMPASVLHFRAGTMADLREITEVFEHAKSHMIAQQIFQWDALYPTGEIYDQDIRRRELTVGMLDGRIAVVYVLNREYDEQYRKGRWQYADEPYLVLHRLCVNPSCQNMGVAKLTMAHIEEVVRAKGIRNIRLDAFSENPFALRLYASCGFRHVGDADCRKGRFYLMEKHLYDV